MNNQRTPLPGFISALLGVIVLAGIAHSQQSSEVEVTQCSCNAPLAVTPHSTRCVRIEEYRSIFAGLPTTQSRGEAERDNCVKVGEAPGVPCHRAPGPYIGSPLTCTLTIREEIDCEFSLGTTVGLGIESGILSAAIERALGFKAGSSVAVEASGTITANPCKFIQLTGRFTNKVGAVGEMAISFDRHDAYRLSNDPTQPLVNKVTRCGTGTTELTFDTRNFTSNLKAVSDLNCTDSNF